MTLEPRSFHDAQLRDLRDASRRQAQSASGVAVAIIGGAFALIAMAAVVVLDYQFNQPVHRVIKLVMAAGLGISVILKPYIGLLALPVITPFLPWIPPVPIPGVNACNLLMGTVFATWIAQRVMTGQPAIRRGRLTGTILLMWLLIALEVVRGSAFPTGYDYDLRLSLIEAFRAIVVLGVYIVALSMVQGDRARRAMMASVIFALIAESAATILLGRSGRGERATGSIGQSNDLGAFLALYVVIAAALIPGIKNWFGKLVLVGGSVMGCIAIVLSVSRSAIIAVGVALFYVGIKSSKMLTLALVLVGLSSPLWVPDFLKDRLVGTNVSEDPDSELEPSAQLRVDTWRAIMRVVTEHPLEGVGFNGLQYVLPETGEELGVAVKDSSHNTFLRMLGEMGIFGLALFIVLLWKCWKLGWDAEKNARNKFDRQLAVGLCAGTLSLAISCAFGDRFFNVLITCGFWVVCALVELSLPPAGKRA